MVCQIEYIFENLNDGQYESRFHNLLEDLFWSQTDKTSASVVVVFPQETLD